MNLGEARITEERATFISTIGSCDVAAARVGGKEKDVAVAASGQNDGVASERTDSARSQIARDNSFRVAIDHNQIEHLGLGKHLDCADPDMSAKRLIRSQTK